MNKTAQSLEALAQFHNIPRASHIYANGHLKWLVEFHRGCRVDDHVHLSLKSMQTFCENVRITVFSFDEI